MSRKVDGRDEMEKDIKGWLALSVKYLAVAATAIGAGIGTQMSESKQLADHERRISENEHRDEAAHTDCARFRLVDLSGFCDPRAVHAVDQQIQRALKDYETKERASAWRRRLKQLNPNLVIIDE